jgi:hypothetical protein
MTARDIFDRLNRGRPPRQFKISNSELARELQKLHEWLQHSDRTSIRLRDICYLGPTSMRKRVKAISLAEILSANGWLIPIKKPRRYDRREWQIVRRAGEYRTIAAIPTPPQNG